MEGTWSAVGSSGEAQVMVALEKECRGKARGGAYRCWWVRLGAGNWGVNLSSLLGSVFWVKWEERAFARAGLRRMLSLR